MQRIISFNYRLASLKHTQRFGIGNQLCFRPFTLTQLQTAEMEPQTFADRYAKRCKTTQKVKLRIGDYSTAEKTFTALDVQTYADITGDDNPVHRVIVSCSQSGALLSAAVGSVLPGAILRDVSLEWKKFLYVNESLHAHVEVVKVLAQKKIVLCEMNAKNGDGVTIVEGKGTIRVRDMDQS